MQPLTIGNLARREVRNPSGRCCLGEVRAIDHSVRVR